MSHRIQKHTRLRHTASDQKCIVSYIYARADAQTFPQMWCIIADHKITNGNPNDNLIFAFFRYSYRNKVEHRWSLSGSGLGRRLKKMKKKRTEKKDRNSTKMCFLQCKYINNPEPARMRWIHCIKQQKEKRKPNQTKHIV